MIKEAIWYNKLKFFAALTIISFIFLPQLALAIHTPNHEGVVPCGAQIVNGQITDACTLRDALTFAISAINFAIQVSGIVAVAMIVRGGAVIMDAALYGNPEHYEMGKKIIVNSLVGLALILLAYATVNAIWALIFGDIVGGTTWSKPWK